MNPEACAVATWFVADSPESGTYFPQIESRSDLASSQAIYWRCVVGFFASSLAVNPSCRHVFFTNADVPTVDGLDIGDLLARWGVDIVHLPITWRLPPRSVESWGNQFYVFDVLQYWGATGGDLPLILLDSDCVWIRSALEIAEAIRKHGAVTYELQGPAEERINGVSRIELAHFASRYTAAIASDAIPYSAGEFIAVSSEVAARISERAVSLWPDVLVQGEGAPREEAHLLSVIYAIEGFDAGGANGVIRRMWTTFRHNDVCSADMELAIWHLPAEKRTGFADLFKQISENSRLDPRRDSGQIGLRLENYARIMGVPRRGAAKRVRDLTLKVRGKVGSRFDGWRP